MRRLLTALLLAAGIAAFAFSTMGAEDETIDANRYWVEMDNAFGMIEGADVKVAGVRAGQIKSFKIDEKTYRALVEIEISAKGFGDLRKDVFCESRPQSLIGEYFLDCLPGKAQEKVAEGSTIPVEQTASTIPVDLVNNIMRRPFRERFSIILGELGAALTARGEDLNETIRRANPALRETDKVLRVLGEQREIIRDLTANADRVVGELAAKRTEVTRFIQEARDTSAASAERAPQIREQFQRLPVFFRELRETMPRLGAAADAQRPAVATLAEQSKLLQRFFNDLGPFSEASRPAFRTLAGAADIGREAVKAARPRVKELGVFAAGLPELVTNLAITLEHLNDRKFAVEKDPRSPGGQGYTGLEAILQYLFRQSQATNTYDGNSYLLKVSVFLDNACAQYTDAKGAQNEATNYCRAVLGPNQPGINQPDPTKKPAVKAKKRTKKEVKAEQERRTEDEKREDIKREIVKQLLPGLDLPEQVPIPPEIEAMIQQLLPEVQAQLPDTTTNTTDGPLMDFLFGK
jgi:ABC-type transporter Mla subunit MlaD